MDAKTARLASVLLATILTLVASPASPAAGVGSSRAGGHANLTVGEGQTRTFSFTAMRMSDGTVRGEGTVNNPSFPIRVHFRLDCLKFDANRVIASGPITQSSDPGTIAVGRIGVFAVEDNGVGQDAAPDRVTTIPDYAPPRTCNDFSVSDAGLLNADGAVVRPWRAIEAGQIHVQP